MEDSRERSIRLIIERAKQDKEDMIRYIDSIITYKLPEITNNSGRVSGLLTDLGSQLDLSFSSSNEQIRDLISLYTEKLIALKRDLEALEITEETLMGNESLLLKQAQDVIELLEPALEKAKNNFYNANKNAFLKSYKQTEETRAANIEEARTSMEKTRISIEGIRASITEKQAQITELRIQKAYIQGQLDITKRRKKRAELQKRIEEIDTEIQNYEGEILKLETQEKEISSPQGSRTETKVVEPIGNQIGEGTQLEGEEQGDGVNR